MKLKYIFFNTRCQAIVYRHNCTATYTIDLIWDLRCHIHAQGMLRLWNEYVARFWRKNTSSSAGTRINLGHVMPKTNILHNLEQLNQLWLMFGKLVL